MSGPKLCLYARRNLRTRNEMYNALRGGRTVLASFPSAGELRPCGPAGERSAHSSVARGRGVAMAQVIQTLIFERYLQRQRPLSI